MHIIIILLVAIVASGGVSVAAEHTVPGDLLYPVKIHVNENVRAAAAVSGEGNAAWETRRTERRFEELEIVLSENTEAQVDVVTDARAALDVQMDRTRDRIAAVESRGDDAAAARLRAGLEATLAAHERVLLALESTHAAEATAVGTLVADMNAERTANAQKRTDAEVRVGLQTNTAVRVAAEEQGKVAERTIADLRASLDTIAADGRVSAEIIADVRVQLDAAAGLWTEAQAALTTQAYGEAFITFQEAHQIAHRAHVTITRADALELRVLPPVSAAPGSAGAAAAESNTGSGADVSTDARAEVNLRLHALRASLRASTESSVSGPATDSTDASQDTRAGVTIDAEQKTTIESDNGGVRGSTEGSVKVDANGALNGLLR